MADDRSKFDEVVDTKGVKVIIDPRALMHLVGTTMDFVEDRLRLEFLPLSFSSYTPLESVKMRSCGLEGRDEGARGRIVVMMSLVCASR